MPNSVLRRSGQAASPCATAPTTPGSPAVRATTRTHGNCRLPTRTRRVPHVLVASSGMRGVRLRDGALDRDPCLADGLKTVARVLGQTAADECPDRGRGRYWQRTQVGFSFDNARQDLRRRLSRIERPAGQHFEEHDAKRPDVRPLVRRFARRLFGRHMRRCTQNDPDLGCLAR